MSKTSTHIIFLKPKSTYRTPLRSDSLWGLLCWGIRFIHGNDDLKSFLDRCIAGEPDFILSSTFPYIDINGKKELYYPRPYLPATESPTKTDDKEKGIKDRKKIKNISQLDQDTFFSIATG